MTFKISLTLFVVEFLLINSVFSADDLNKTVTENSFVANEIVPQIIPVAPTAIVNVTFPSGAVVNLGDELTPTLVKDAPDVQWDAGLDQFYTLIVIDPDAPSRSDPLFREWLHWSVGNIPGVNVTDGDTLADYVGAGPPQNGGFHRYVYLVYQQPGQIIFNETRLNNTSDYFRAGFSIVTFSKKYNLSDPVFGNFYQAAYDSSVPELYKQLGLSAASGLICGNFVFYLLVFVSLLVF